MTQLVTKLQRAHRCSLKAAVLITVLLFVLSFNSLAINPGKIEGSVSDGETYKPVPFARVDLLKSNDSVVVKTVQTTEDGKYLLDDIAFGRYLIRVSCLTYKIQIISDFDITPQRPSIKFGVTNLLPESKTLGEVNITGYKLTGQMEEDKTIYTIKSKSAELAQSGLELLRQLPDVTVSYMSNEVKLAGSTNILFQVNGKKVTSDYLNQLNPKLVDKVEVITNPGVKYDSDVDAVINIILKRNMQYGLSGRIRTQFPSSKTILSNNNVSFDMFMKKVRIYATGFYSMQQFDMKNTSERTYKTIGTSILQDGGGNYLNQRGGFSYGLDWFPDDNNTFNFYSSVQPRIPVDNTYKYDVTYLTSTSRLDSLARNVSGSKNLFYDYSLFYKHKFKKKNHEISFEGYLSDRTALSTNDYYYYENPELAETGPKLNERNQNTENDNQQLSLKADYTYPFTDNLKLSLGYNGNFNRAENTYHDLVGQYYDSLKYNEDRNVGYTSIAWNKGNLNLQTGIRYEFSDIHIIHGMDSTYQYNYWLPSASMQYKLGKSHTFRLNYRRYPQRPSVDQLSPANYRNDSYSQSTGNPKLNPAYSDRFEFTHRIQIKGPLFVSYRPYFSLVKKGIRQVILPSKDLIQRKVYDNVSNEFEYGITLSGTLAFVKWWSISPSYTYYKRELNALPEYGIFEKQRGTSWRFNVSSQMILPKEWIVFTEYYYGAPVISQQSSSVQNYEFVTGFYKAVKKNFTITAFIVNPWETQYIFNKTVTETADQKQTTKGYVDYKYLFMVRLGYSFNYGKEGKKVERQQESEEDNSGRKGMF